MVDFFAGILYNKIKANPHKERLAALLKNKFYCRKGRAEMENQTTPKINVAEIMESIRAEIQEMGYSSDMLSFADIRSDAEAEMEMEQFDADMLRHDVQYLTANHRLEPYPKLSGNPVSVFFKKIARKLTRFDMEPCAAEQSSFNASVAQAQQQIELYIQESRLHSTRVLLERIEILELQQKNAHIAMAQMQAQIQALQQQLFSGEEPS